MIIYAFSEEVRLREGKTVGAGPTVRKTEMMEKIRMTLRQEH